MTQELKVIQDFYGFMLWLVNHTEKFPRPRRRISRSTGAAEMPECSAIAARGGVGWHWLATVGSGFGGCPAE